MIDFYPYEKDLPLLFKKEKRKIKEILPEAGVDHTGSTAIPGVGGKGIIDVLVSLPDWTKKKEAVKSLEKLGFTHVHPEESGRIFLSRRAETGKGDTHIHLVEQDNKDYKEKIFFRDYLRENKREAEQYNKLKKKAVLKAEGDRHKYGTLKNSFINKIIKKFKE